MPSLDRSMGRTFARLDRAVVSVGTKHQKSRKKGGVGSAELPNPPRYIDKEPLYEQRGPSWPDRFPYKAVGAKGLPLRKDWNGSL